MRFFNVRNAIYEAVVQKRFSFHKESLYHFTNLASAISILKSGVLKAKSVPAYEMDDEEYHGYISFTEEHFWDEPERTFYLRSVSVPIMIAFDKKFVHRSGAQKVKYTEEWFDENIYAVPYILDAPIFSETEYERAREELKGNGEDEEEDWDEVEEIVRKNALEAFLLAKDESEWIKEGDLSFSWKNVLYVSSRSSDNVKRLVKEFPKQQSKIIGFQPKKSLPSLQDPDRSVQIENLSSYF